VGARLLLDVRGPAPIRQFPASLFVGNDDDEDEDEVDEVDDCRLRDEDDQLLGEGGKEEEVEDGV
jgi:hypothetical protein